MSIFRRDNNEKALATTENDPFRWMNEMMRWDPFLAVTRARPELERTFVPAFEVKETKDSFQFKADLPGIKEADVEIQITGNRLAITGKREVEHEDKSDTYYTYERSFGSFQRAFMLPDGLDTDHVHAELKDGVLTVALPKKANAQTKTVTIKGAGQPKS